MEPDEGFEDEGPFFAWVPPDDRLWRHPSEVHGLPPFEGGNDLMGSEAPGTGDYGRRRASRRWATSWWMEVGRLGGRTWSVVVAAGLAGAVAAYTVGVLSGSFAKDKTVVQSVLPDTAAVSVDPVQPASGDWTEVDQAVAPSVVSIQVSSASGVTAGSGFLFVEGLGTAYVITDGTLVDSGGSIVVTFLSGEQDHGRLVGSDPVTDLAVVAVPDTTTTFPEVASVADLQVAGPVLAVGSRLAQGGSVFPGTVSAEDQEVDLTGGTAMQNLIEVSGSGGLPQQTAGGPLLDESGSVVGVTVSLDPVDPNDEDMAFAVPVDVAEQVTAQLLAKRAPTHPWLGVVDAEDLSGTLASDLGLSAGAQAGAVWPGSPAAKAGISPSDVITSLDGKPVVGAGSLTQLLTRCQPNQQVRLSWVHLRGNHVVQLSATVRLEEQPTNSPNY